MTRWTSTRRWVNPRSAWTWAAIGLGLAPGAPLGLWVVFKLTGADLSDDVCQMALIYSGVATAVVFVTFGGLTGRLMDRLRSASLHDGLTGLFNRRFLRESLPQLQAAAARRSQPLCVLMLDLDLFKRVNDAHGHLVGDQTLCAVAETLRRHSRRSDLVARYGGEEFAVLCPDTDGETGLQVAERLREAVEALGEDRLGHPGPQTVSVGVAIQSPEHELAPEVLLDHADMALYRAKHRGRNQTVAWLDGQELA
ncbi:GGDEF domain-containing protein [Enhygromyxa salina]|uniref:GGDEF domain-containing protein n=1 Tax=Enhygromyxa salina TaxID=215803 RepID=UPI0015E5AF53|nr:GGDEF domain-containing protein [Enhygromyxa salina]